MDLKRRRASKLFSIQLPHVISASDLKDRIGLIDSAFKRVVG